MKEGTEVFNNLRDYQLPIFNQILGSGNRILLKAPMDFGKTYLACVYVSRLFHEGNIRSATFAIQNYQMRIKIVSDLKKVGIDNTVIVCLEGRERAFRPHKKRRITSLNVNREELKGKVIDIEYVEKKWKSYNPYYVLLYLQRYADVIIVHHSMLASNKRIRKTDFLIVDDADLMNRDEVFTIARYKVFRNHLQADENSTTDAKEILAKLSRYEERMPYTYAFLKHYLSYFPDNPGDLETNSVLEVELRSEKNQSNPIARMFSEKEMEGKTEEEKLQYLLTRKQTDIMIGIRQASNPVKWNSFTNELKLRIKNDAELLRDNIEKEMNYGIAAHIDYRLERFLEAFSEPQFHVKLSGAGDWQTLEINLTNGSDFMEVVNQYAKVLWISATADPDDPEFEGFKLVQSTFDPHSEHKHIQEISRDVLPDVLEKMKNHNVFIITASGSKATEFQKLHGGEMLTSDTYETLIRNARTTKGNVVISYVNGIGSRGLDDLADLFDAVIVDSWIYRSVTQREGKFYDDEFFRQNLKDAAQIIGRIMRGSKDHILLLVKDETESGSKLKEYIVRENPSWKTYDGDSISGLIQRIPERTDKEQKKTILRKETRTLKDGSKELIYRAKATDEEINHAPDFIPI